MKKSHWYVKDLALTPSFDTELRPGDYMTYTNEFGVSFQDLMVIGFSREDDSSVYIDSDCWWTPKPLHSLQKQCNQDPFQAQSFDDVVLPANLSLSDIPFMVLSHPSIGGRTTELYAIKAASDTGHFESQLLDSMTFDVDYLSTKERFTKIAHHYGKALIDDWPTQPSFT